MEAKAQRLFNARAKAESNLAQIHQDTLDAINKDDRRAKIDKILIKLVEKGRACFDEAVDKNDELLKLSLKCTDPETQKREPGQWLSTLVQRQEAHVRFTEESLGERNAKEGSLAASPSVSHKSKTSSKPSKYLSVSSNA